MRRIIAALLFLIIPAVLGAQQQFCERDALGYRICFTLKSNHTFFYEFNHCTGSLSGQGKYSRHPMRIVFQFDSVTRLAVRYDSISSVPGMIRICYREYFSHEPFSYGQVYYRGRKYLTDTLGNAEIPYSGGEIVVKQMLGRDSLVLDPGSRNASLVNIDWIWGGTNFVKAGSSMTFHRHGKQWILREPVAGGGEEKTHRRKRYRQVVYVFKGE